MENNCHKSLNIESSSKYVGVSFYKRTNKWQTNICVLGKRTYLGRYDTEEEAHAKRVEYQNNNNIENKYL